MQSATRCTARLMAAGSACAPPQLALVAASCRGLATVAAGKAENSMNELWMRALEPKPPAYPRFSAAEQAQNQRLANTYTKLMWKRDRILKKDINRKLLLKWAAIHALPTEELRRAALVVDPWIPTLKIPRHTPPLAGFHGPEDVKAEAAKKAAEEAEAAGTAGKISALPPQNRSGAGAKKGAGKGGFGADLMAMRGFKPISADKAGAPSAAPETGASGMPKRGR